MTRRRLRRQLTVIWVGLGLTVAIAGYAGLSDSSNLTHLYNVIKDMSLLIATAIATYLAYVFQQRITFLQSLREEWRRIVDTKAELVTYCRSERPSVKAYEVAYSRLSQTIDYMRIVYANVGETKTLVGLYPYEPLHDVRRIMEELDPRKNAASKKQREAACDQIVEAFQALREHFLEEFELEEPSHPIIMRRARRTKRSGYAESIRRNHVNKLGSRTTEE